MDSMLSALIRNTWNTGICREVARFSFDPVNIASHPVVRAMYFFIHIYEIYSVPSTDLQMTHQCTFMALALKTAHFPPYADKASHLNDSSEHQTDRKYDHTNLNQHRVLFLAEPHW